LNQFIDFHESSDEHHTIRSHHSFVPVVFSTFCIANMVSVPNLYLAFGLMTTTNETMGLGM
jgi:hypothetical protein